VRVQSQGFLGPKTEDLDQATALIHNGDEFISVLTEDGVVLSIRSDAIESYNHRL
jgi:hypothetical protein